MSELDDKMRETLAEQFPWAKDHPLSHEIVRIMQDAKKGGVAEKKNAILDVMNATINSVMPHVELSEVTMPYMVVALRAILKSVEEQLDDSARMQVTMLSLVVGVQTTTIKLPNDDFGEKK